jgi:hypothetical protein
MDYDISVAHFVNMPFNEIFVHYSDYSVQLVANMKYLGFTWHLVAE